MDFSWPEEYTQYQQQVVEFAQGELNEGVIENDETQSFPMDLWRKCAEFGIQGLALPAQYGGPLEEVDFLRAMLAMEGLGYGCQDNGLPFAMNAQMWTVQTPILHFGSEEQKSRYLPAMASGQIIGSHALTEPEVGSDVFSMQLKAEKVEGGYLLNGQKHLITLGPICDFSLVFANSRPNLGKWGVSAFLVDKGTPGFKQSAKMSKMGMRCVPIGAFDFEDCFLPEEQRLGGEGLGFSILNHSLEYDRCCILASQLGAMQSQLEEAISYAKSRTQSGQSIGKFQSVANRIVDMKLRLESSRLLLHKTAWLKKEGRPAMIEAALLKLYLSEAFIESSIDSMRTFGGKSYLVQHGIERNLRDAVGGVLYAGTSDIQRNIVAKLLGL
ncbi:MAG: acyl-CoA dehydrogenase family protein [Bacteroidota bacterium]